MKTIRVELPGHLRLLARLGHEVTVGVEEPVTQRRLLDALEAAYPMLAGTIRDHAADHTTKVRRPFMRFFACGEDLSHVSPDEVLPAAVVNGDEAFLVMGAIAGG